VRRYRFAARALGALAVAAFVPGLFVPRGTADAQAGPTLRFLTEESGRFSYVENGEVRGIFVDLMREVARRADVDASFDLLPWKRAYEGALTEPDACVFATTMTDERRPQFKWVAPLAFNKWALLGLKARHIRLGRLEDAKPYVIGVYEGDARQAYLKQRGFTLAPVSRNELNISGLETGRIDLWASSAYAPFELGGEVSSKLESVLEFHSVELGVACNVALSDAITTRLNTALAQVRAERGLDRGDGAN